MSFLGGPHSPMSLDGWQLRAYNKEAGGRMRPSFVSVLACGGDTASTEVKDRGMHAEHH